MVPTPVGKWVGCDVFGVLHGAIPTLLVFLRIWGPNFKKMYAILRGRGPLFRRDKSQMWVVLNHH